MDKQRLYIAGHNGMVGSAILRFAQEVDEYELITASRSLLDLRNAQSTLSFLKDSQPDVVIVAAAKVGGIHSNSTYPADFLYDNLTMATSLIHGSFQAGVKRLLFLGSSCIYPKHAIQPITENALLTSPLEPTNEAYAIAKIAGLKLCEYYRKQHRVLYHSAMPTNLYGPGDNYHLDNSHVIPGMLHRFHTAKEQSLPEVTIWGSGTPLREFLYVDDLASACYHLIHLTNPPDWVNVGYGEDITILDLALTVARVVGYKGTIKTDPTKPDGTPRKLMSSSLLRETGWEPTIDLQTGLRLAYADYLQSKANGQLRAK